MPVKEHDPNIKNGRGWSPRELMQIAEGIRKKITDERPVSLEQYVALAEKAPINYLEAWIVRKEPLTHEFFPDEVIPIISRKIGNQFRGDGSADEFIETNLHEGSDWIASRLYLRRASVMRRAKKLGIKIIEKNSYYSNEEDEKLTQGFYSGLSDKEISQTLKGRVTTSITGRRRRLGLRRKNHMRWENHPEYVQYILDNPDKTYKQIAKDLGLTICQLETQVYRKKLRRNLPRHIWKKHPKHVQYIGDNFQNKSYRQIAKNLGLRRYQVEKKARRMGLSKR